MKKQLLNIFAFLLASTSCFASDNHSQTSYNNLKLLGSLTIAGATLGLTGYGCYRKGCDKAKKFIPNLQQTLDDGSMSDTNRQCGYARSTQINFDRLPGRWWLNSAGLIGSFGKTGLAIGALSTALGSMIASMNNDNTSYKIPVALGLATIGLGTGAYFSGKAATACYKRNEINKIFAAQKNPRAYGAFADTKITAIRRQALFDLAHAQTTTTAESHEQDSSSYRRDYGSSKTTISTSSINDPRPAIKYLAYSNIAYYHKIAALAGLQFPKIDGLDEKKRIKPSNYTTTIDSITTEEINAVFAELTS